MSYYECVFIARQDLLQSQAEALTEVYEKVLQDHQGVLVNKEYWGLKNLAYPIKKNKRGHYMFLNIEAPAAAIQEMERQMRFNEDVIRYLSIKVDALEKGPSIMLRQQEREREEGGRESRYGRDRGERHGDFESRSHGGRIDGEEKGETNE